jgi:glycolate oxidase FAD binding subunit
MDVAEIVGAAYVRAGEPQDAVDWVIPRLVAMPGNAEEVAAILRMARDTNLHVLPRGGGTKLGWGNRPGNVDIVLDVRRMNAVVEHAWGDMTATVQTGCTVAELQNRLAEHGQRLAIDALWPERATIGGIIATNDSGAFRVRYGSLRDQVIGMTIALADGTLAKSGGKVVKNVAGYDLPKLMTGALGTLGVIVEATFRLYPLPLAIHDETLVMPDIATAHTVLLAIQDSTIAPAAVQLRIMTDHTTLIDLCFEGVEAALIAQQQQLAELVRGVTGHDSDQIRIRADDAAAGIAPPVMTATNAIWRAREALWDASNGALVTKISLLISDLATVTALIERVCTKLRMKWQLVLNAQGVGMLRIDGANDEALLAGLIAIRQELAGFDASLSALGCPPAIKSRIDVWGEPGDALDLMRRVKERFDPTRVLNAGRFVGKI